MISCESVVAYSDLRAGLNYFCLDSAILKSLDQTEEFKYDYHISDKKFKHVEDRILLHNLFNNIIETLRKCTFNPTFKRVLFVSEDMVKRKEMKSEVLLKQLQILKRLLPVPIVIPLSNDAFTVADGKMKELNNKCLHFYTKKKIKLKELKKYFDDKGYSALSATLSSTVNLKGLYY